MEFDFEKNGTVSDLNAVPEAYRGLYVEKDGEDGKVYSIADTVKPLVDAYAGTNKALNEARGNLKKANEESASRRVTKKAVVDFAKELGIEEVDESEPLGALKAHIDGLVEKVKGGQDIRINLDKIKQDHQKALAEAVASKDGEIAKKDAALTRYLVDQAATAALAQAKGSVELLLPHVKAHTKVVQDGDDYVVRVVDSAGDFRSNGKGGFMSVNDLVAEMKTQETFGRAFESEASGGTGAKPGSMHQRQQREGEPKSSVDKISAGLAKGQHGRGRA